MSEEERLRFLDQSSESFIKEVGELEALNNSRSIGEDELLSIAKLLSTARSKNGVLKNTLILLRKHNYLLDSENKLLKKRIGSLEMVTQRLEAELKLKAEELRGLQQELERREARMKEVLKTLKEERRAETARNAAKLDALVAQIDAKKRRMQDYKRETAGLKEELATLKKGAEMLQEKLEKSGELRGGLVGVINGLRKEFKVFALLEEGPHLKLPELRVGVAPGELHVLEVEGASSFFFDAVFPP